MYIHVGPGHNLVRDVKHEGWQDKQKSKSLLCICKTIDNREGGGIGNACTDIWWRMLATAHPLCIVV